MELRELSALYFDRTRAKRTDEVKARTCFNELPKIARKDAKTQSALKNKDTKIPRLRSGSQVP